MPEDDQPSSQGAARTHWWQRIHGAIRMLCFLVVGVIALGVAANAAPVKKTSGTVTMGQIVAAGDSVYALASDKSAVYEWSEGLNNWRKVKGTTEKLYAGGDAVYAIEPGRGDISKYDTNTDKWPVIGGPGATFAATSKHLYGISPDHNMVMEYDAKKNTWRKVGDRAQDLYAGPQGALYVTNPDDKTIHRYDGQWNVVGGPGATFAVTDQSLFGLTPDHKAVVQYDAGRKKWTAIGGPAGTILAGNNLYATNPDTGDLYKYGAGRWDRISDKAAAFATSGYHLYRLTPDGHSVQTIIRRGIYEEWKDLRGPAAVLATRDQKIAQFNTLNQEGAASRKAWKAARDAYRKGQPDIYEFNWSTNYCNFPAPDIALGVYDFRDACARHDFLYRNYKDIHGDKAFQNNPDGQARADEILRLDMIDTCSKQVIGSRQICESHAAAYYEGVRLHSQVDG
ncbi:phospholipase A2 [Streptomyces sp. NPDC096136]|uniref:phospholipase A2 n=1 Tax=Streptomyces sp. NPDC096136 TaxID=3366076 RepID=UPI00383097A8